MFSSTLQHLLVKGENIEIIWNNDKKKLKVVPILQIRFLSKQLVFFYLKVTTRVSQVLQN